MVDKLVLKSAKRAKFPSSRVACGTLLVKLSKLKATMLTLWARPSCLVKIPECLTPAEQPLTPVEQQLTPAEQPPTCSAAEVNSTMLMKTWKPIKCSSIQRVASTRTKWAKIRPSHQEERPTTTTIMTRRKLLTSQDKEQLKSSLEAENTWLEKPELVKASLSELEILR